MFDDHAPIYRQIADAIRRDVLDGTLGEGDKVMSTTQYAVHFRINPATAAKAFQDLVDQGVLEKHRGVGMFVADGARARLQDDYRRTFFEDFVDPMFERATALGISLDDVIGHIRRRGEGADE
jgi:DNA-binding transcriptional regulator YhcF (GntR family)